MVAATATLTLNLIEAPAEAAAKQEPAITAEAAAGGVTAATKPVFHEPATAKPTHAEPTTAQPASAESATGESTPTERSDGQSGAGIGGGGNTGN
jgi:hypothetical protein